MSSTLFVGELEEEKDAEKRGIISIPWPKGLIKITGRIDNLEYVVTPKSDHIQS